MACSPSLRTHSAHTSPYIRVTDRRKTWLLTRNSPREPSRSQGHSWCHNLRVTTRPTLSSPSARYLAAWVLYLIASFRPSSLEGAEAGEGHHLGLENREEIAGCSLT